MSVLEPYLDTLFTLLHPGGDPEKVIPEAATKIQELRDILVNITPDELVQKTKFGGDYFKNSLYDYVLFAFHDNTQLSHIDPLRKLLQDYERSIVLPLTQKLLQHPRATVVLNKIIEDAVSHDTIRPLEGKEPTTDICGIRGMYQTFGSLFAHGFFDTMSYCLTIRGSNPELFYIPRGLIRNIEIVAGALREIEDLEIIDSLRRLLSLIQSQPDYDPTHYFFPEYCDETSPIKMYSRTNPPMFNDDLLINTPENTIVHQEGFISKFVQPEYGPFENSLVHELVKLRKSNCRKSSNTSSKPTSVKKTMTRRRKSRRRKSRRQRRSRMV